MKSQQASLKFNPVGKCPVYEVPADVIAEVKAKQRQDDQQIASLSSRVSLAPIRTGRDGGMHPTFLAKLKPQEVREQDGTIRYVVDKNAASKLGSYVNPPLETYPDETSGTAVASAPAAKQKQKGGAIYATASAESKPAPAPTKTAYAPTLGRRLLRQDEELLHRRRRQAGAAGTGGREAGAEAAPRPQTAAKQPATGAATRTASAGARTGRASRAEPDARAPVGGERREPDERRGPDGPDRQLRRALGRGAVSLGPHPEAPCEAGPRRMAASSEPLAMVRDASP